LDYCPKKAAIGGLKTRKDVEIYQNGLETEISYFTCHKLLKSMGFKTEKKPLLTATHRSKRLNWANAHKNWTRNNLHRMIFSDKTKIIIRGSDGIKECWKKSDNKLQFHNLKLTVKHGDSLMVWCCITYNGHKDACQIPFDGTTKKRNCIYNLKTIMKDALNGYGFDSKNIYFKQYKVSKKYTIKLTKLCFKD
jgi:hypothetical protein